MKPPDLTHLGLVTLGDEAAWAVTSEDDRYRYILGRTWDPEPGLVLSVVMMNPSKARHDESDNTIDKLILFGKAHRCAGLVVRNLFAFSTKSPKVLAAEADPVGPKNLEVLALMFPPALHVAAWGNFPTRRIQALAQRAALTYRGQVGAALKVFGKNLKTGEPKHPLYLPGDTRLVFWEDAVPS